MALAACSDSATEPDRAGLVTGTYRASFTVPLSTSTPGGLIGDHEFTWRVGEPTDPASFELLSSRRRSRTLNGEATDWESGYLNPSTEHILANASFWRVQWRIGDLPTLRVNVTVTQEPDGFDWEFCRGVRGVAENFAARDCEVRRIER